MKIITTSYEDFVNNEIAEHGHDYVEGMFLSGNEPLRSNGIWIWGKNVSAQLLRSIDVTTNSSTSALHGSRSNRISVLK